MNQFNQAQQYPGQQLGVLQSALGMTPYGSTSIGSSSGQQQTTTTPSLMSDVTGGLQALGSLTGAGGPFAASAPRRFDADRLRPAPQDRHHPGRRPPGDRPADVQLSLQGRPKVYPKVIGPMAEDAMQVAPHAVRTVGVHGPTGQAMHGVDMNALDQAGPPMGANDNSPAIRPGRMPGAGGGFTTRVPGALAPPTPMGLTGALGSSMRAQRMRPPGRTPRVAGGLSG